MKYIKVLILALVLLISSCAKYLDAVPDKSLTVPRTVSDFQQLLNNETMFNNAPALGELSSDDVFMPDILLSAQNITFQNAYVWANDIFGGLTTSNWNKSYEKAYYANIVLDGAEKLKDENAAAADVNLLKGWALFCRANAFYDLEEVFGQPYRPLTATSDLGIPLKLSTNLNEKIVRATVAVTYQQIVKDLEEAVILLPNDVSKTNRSRPSKPAAYALLARVYLVMQNYEQALRCSTSSLELYKNLLDYNGVSVSAKLPFSPIIDEVLYNSIQLSYSDRTWQVDRALYDSFASNDLRKVLFFTEDLVAKTVVFKGFYANTYVAFNGLTTDEVYLTKAECEARLGQGQFALDDLNVVLLKRFKTGTYVPYSLVNTADILSLVLKERRKECLFRNLRWADLRRLNQDARFAKTITRVVNGKVLQLQPNDPKYALPIPDDEIRGSGIVQNFR